MSVPLASGIDAIKSGEAFKAAPSMSELGDIGLAAATSAVDQITQTWSALTNNLSTTLSVTSSQVKVIELKAKSEGREPTPEELDEACGPLSFLAKAKTELEEALSGIFGQVESFASEFGQTIASFANDLNTLVDEVANAVDEVAQEIAQAALDAFEAVNAVAMEALAAVEGAINSAVGFVNDAVAEAEALLNSAIDEMLAFADSLNFASLFSLDCQKEAVANAVDSEKVADAAEVDRVIAPTPTTSSNTGVELPNEPTPPSTEPPGYWTADDGRLTLLSTPELFARASAGIAPFGSPGKTPDGLPKFVVARANDTGKMYIVISSEPPQVQWTPLTLDEAAAKGATILASLRADDNKKVPIPQPPTPDKLVTSPTLTEPQTEFAQVQTAVPPSLTQLIENFRSAARVAVLAGQELSIAYVEKRPSLVSIAERDALNLAADQEKNKLFLEAANQGVPANDLPIYGPEFNLTARGIEAAQQPAAASSKLQQTIDELAPIKSKYNSVNQEQGQLAVKLKFDILPSTPDNIRLFNEKNAEAKSLRQQLVSKIDALSPKDQQAVEKEIGSIPVILKP
jgi:hypothetical protein